MSELSVVPLASTTSDNFFALFHSDGLALLVDPIDASLAIESVRSRALDLVGVLVTHWHPDHVAGNAAVRAAFPDAELIGPAAEADLIEQLGALALTREVVGTDTVELGVHTFTVLDTPGHTVGHISFHSGHHLVSGDVLFAAGAGNVRTGDPGVLFATFRDVLRPMPDETVYYAGHDYAERNLEFALSILDEDPELIAALEAAKRVPPRTFEPRTIGSERTTNLFMRFDDDRVLDALEAKHPELLAEQRALSAGGEDHEAAFRTLRALRNVW